MDIREGTPIGTTKSFRPHDTISFSTAIYFEAFSSSRTFIADRKASMPTGAPQ